MNTTTTGTTGTVRLLTPYNEVMQQLGGIGRTMLFELINDGHLEKVNIGRRGFITTASITAYVNSLSVAGGPE